MRRVGWFALITAIALAVILAGVWTSLALYYRLPLPEGARVALIGGEPLGHRFMAWNFVSSRAEQLPPEWRTELAQLQSEVEPFPLGGSGQDHRRRAAPAAQRTLRHHRA